MNTLIFGEHQENTLEQMELATSDESVVASVLCADGHLGYSVPIGGVIAYDGKINPAGVGYDIACGNMAVRLKLSALHAENILARKYFWPGCHGMAPYRDLFPHARMMLPNTERVAERVIVLPTGTTMEIESIQLITDLLQYLSKSKVIGQ